ncbi:LssY C-terminal domain-containing protein [Edaphobacter aggregans]|uniref:LssY C-terminal domain-containing protein n=1 Tax=Edaphobacter aggregans TaxID=570835 RepID=UPI0005522DDB|nr:LssY C-terminal domain-containing protein [Edaphobacter aggregans]
MNARSHGFSSLGRTIFLGWLLLAAGAASLCARAQSPSATQPLSAAPEAVTPITIVRQAGHEDGVAQIVEKGKKKPRKIAPHAVSAWRVRGGDGALVVVLQPAKGRLPKQYILRYYDLDTGRRRVLGRIPMSTASLVETKATDERWAFALSGTDVTTGKPFIVVGDDQAIPGLLPGGASPAFHDDTTVSYTEAGATKTARLGVLLGRELRDIYAPPQTAQTAPKFLQVFPNGDAMVELKDGSIQKARWRTNGEIVDLIGDKATYAVPVSGLMAVKGVPAGQRLGVRLLQDLSSRTTHEGDVVKSVSITPVVVNGEILIPAGTTLEGKVVQADGVGWGFKHERASLTIDWTKATLPDGRVLDVDMRVYEVENAQEKVTETGKIQGIRSTGTIGYTVQNGVLAFAGIDPIAYIFAAASGSAVLGFAEPEILYPGGTELLLVNVRPLITSTSYPSSMTPMEKDAAGREQLQAFVKKLPFRTRTKGSNKPSDITNLVFIGDPAALERAFTAAGWLETDELYAASTFKTVKTLTGNQAYMQAPMSVLLLEERAPILTLSKTTNSFASRHHLRIFPTTERYDGETVLTSSSTQDIGIAFSKKQKTFIHVIDQQIDNERSKVVNDLMFTGCVESLDMVERPWVPRDAYNSTGDRLLTDGEAAVIRLNNCDHPHTTPTTPAPAPNRTQRATRDTSLTIRSDLYRGNFIYMGIAGILQARNYLRSASELPAETGAWRKTDASGADYTALDSSGSLSGADRSNTTTAELHERQTGEFNPTPTAEDLAAIEKAKADHKWDPPRYEFAVHGGYMHMREDYLSAVGVIEYSSVPTNPTYFIFLADNVGDGWAAGGSVTLNSWKHFSNEFSYFRQQVKYELNSINATIPPGTDVIFTDEDLVTDRIGLVTRQFEYNLLIHATKPTSRWRPYAAVGPVLQLIALNGSPLKKPAGPFNLGLKNIGLIKAAFDFGRTAPLDGGGIFQFGLQYGAGVKFRVTPRLTIRADFRETWSRNPDIIADSYQDYDSNELDETYTTDVLRVGPEKKFLQDRYTVGVAFTF